MSGPESSLCCAKETDSADRLLLPSEKPVTIQLRRFLQAGYNESDNLEELGRENFAMLCRFIYQPPVLPVIGPVSRRTHDLMHHIGQC